MTAVTFIFRTPLMLAVTLERLDCVTHLLDKGANVEVENNGGWTGKNHKINLFKFLYIHIFMSNFFYYVTCSFPGSCCHRESSFTEDGLE